MANWAEIRNKIVLEGEAGYKKGMAEINRALRESKSEMKAVAAEYASNDNSAEALTAQIAALENVEQGQILALETMRNHLEKVASEYGDNSREAVELRTKINNMRAEMAKTGSELRDFRGRMNQTADAMEDASRAASGMDDDLHDTERAFAGIADGAKEASGATEGLIGKLSSMTGLDLTQIAAVVGGLGAGLKSGSAVVDAALAGVRSSVEQTQARGQIAAYTGKSGVELEALETIAHDVYKEGFGDDLKDAAQGVATVNSYTKAENEDLQRSTEIAFRLNDVFGMDIPGSARTAAQLMTVFGGSAEEAYRLIVAGAQEGADKNGNLLETLNEYAPYYAKAGKSAEEFMGTLTAGAQRGVYDVDKIGDSMKEFCDRIIDGSETTKEALKTLGVETADLPAKFAQGGDTASAAFDLVVDRISEIEDPLKQGQVGVALFGEQWKDTAGAILPIFGSISSGAVDAALALETLNNTRTKDLDVSMDRVGRRVGERMGEVMEPVAAASADALNVLADNIDKNGGKIISGIMDTLAQSNEQLAMGAAMAYEAASKEYDDWAADFRNKVASGEWIDALVEQYGTIGDEAAAAAEAAESSSEGLREKLDELNDQLREADKAGDMLGAARLMAQRKALIDEIARAESEAAEGMLGVGESAAEALSSTDGDMQEAAQDVADTAVEAIEEAEPDAESAGEVLGEATVEGYEAGANGMEQAGRDAAAGAEAGAMSATGALYSAGAALGGAFRRGFRNEMMIRSPSRAAMEDMGYVTDGYIVQAERDRERLRAASAALAEAVRGGMRERIPGVAGALYGADSAPYGTLTAEAIAEATARALSGMGVYIGEERAGELLEPSVSRSTARRSMGTIRGQSAKAKRW